MAETDHRLFTQFERRLGETVSNADKPFVNQCLSDYTGAVLDYIGRDELPERLDSAVVYLSVGAYNKRGAEGETSRSEGGISREFDDLPPDIRKRLENYPKLVGVVK